MVLSEIVYVLDSNPWINGPQHNFTFLPGSMYLLISCFGKTGCNGLSHWVVVFAIERGLHVVISVTLWGTAIQTFGLCNKYLRKLALAWVYLASLSEISAVVLGSTVSCQKGRTEQKCSSCTGTRSDRKWPETRYASKGCPQWPIFFPSKALRSHLFMNWNMDWSLMKSITPPQQYHHSGTKP